MDRSSRSREKKDKAYDYPKGAGSRFESEYSRSYTKPNTSRESPYIDSSYANNLSSPNHSNSVARANKPQTPYPTTHSSARNFYRSSTAVPAAFRTLNTINKMEEILKKSVGLPTNEKPGQNSSQEASARGSAVQSSGANKNSGQSGHMSQMYGMKGGGGVTPRSDDNCSAMREGDNTWTVNGPKVYDRNISEEAQGKHCMTKEDQRRKGQGDITNKGPQKIPNRPASILVKPRSNISINHMTSRWAIDKRPANKATSLRKVRFSDNITTHLVPYEERGSQEWRKNILAMNMNCRSFLGGYPNLRNLPLSMPMPLQDFSYKGSRPSTGYDPALLMPLMLPSSQSRSIENDWSKGLRDNYGNSSPVLGGDYQAEPDMNRHFDSGPKNTKSPKSPYHDKGVYNFPTPRRR